MRILLALLLLPTIGFSQITVTDADFGNTGDTVRMSATTDLGVDYTSTGTNWNWDFSSFVAESQTLIEFNDVSGASTLVQILFGETHHVVGERGREHQGLTLQRGFGLHQNSGAEQSPRRNGRNRRYSQPQRAGTCDDQRRNGNGKGVIDVARRKGPAKERSKGQPVHKWRVDTGGLGGKAGVAAARAFGDAGKMDKAAQG
mgnify:CR=1 FL=1